MKNLEHQVKAKWYYIFWCIMAAAVCSGQWYVGTGYREMVEATKSSEISVSCVLPYETPRNKVREFE
jgi:hypothetical protein